MKISAKLTIAFLTVGLLVLFVGFFSAKKSQEIFQESVGQETIKLARVTLDKIDRTIYLRAEQLQAYFEDLILQDIIKKSNSEFSGKENYKLHIQEKDKEWGSVDKEAVTPFMQEIVNNKLSGNLQKIMDYYERKYGYKVFGEIFITNKFGANIAQTGKTTDYFQADEDWWQKAKEKGLHIEDIKYDESANIFSMDICIRLDDYNGNFIGVLKAVFDYTGLFEIIEALGQFKTYKSETLKLTSGKGTTIFDTNTLKFQTEIDKHQPGLLSNSKYTIIQREGEKEKLSAHVHSERYKNYGGFNWFLTIEYETEEIFAPIVDLRRKLLLISFIVANLAIGLGLFVSRSIALPISKLKDASVKIGSGDLNVNIEIAREDEIGELAKSFSEMANSLKDSTTSKAYVDNIINSITDILFVMNSNGKITAVNRAVFDHLGFSEKELIGQDVNCLFHFPSLCYLLYYLLS